MKYCFRADHNAYDCIVVSVNSFGSANLTVITTHIT